MNAPGEAAWRAVRKLDKTKPPDVLRMQHDRLVADFMGYVEASVGMLSCLTSLDSAGAQRNAIEAEQLWAQLARQLEAI